MSDVTRSNNGMRKAGIWFLDKLAIFVLAILISGFVWLVNEIFALRAGIETLRAETIQKTHEIQLKNVERIALLESEVRLANTKLDDINKRLSDVCLRLQVQK